MNPAGNDLFELLPLPVGDAPVSLAVALPRPELTRLPGFPQAATPQAGRVASGRGLTSALCRASALGEAAELVSCCAWGTEPLILAQESELGPKALSPEVLNGFSQAQTGEREPWNRHYAGFDWRPPRRDRRRPIEWLEVKNAYDGPSAYVPADFAFIGRRATSDGEAVAVGDSNGCACGPDVDSAKLAAVLELVERDAAARWWYGRRRRPSLDVCRILTEGTLTDWLSSRPRRSWAFDITTDIQIPVVAAVSADDADGDVALGFSARLDIHDALVSALTEMIQIEFSLGAARELGDAAGYWAEWRARVRMGMQPLWPVPAPDICFPSRNTPSALMAAIDACARSDIPLWFADMTREAVGVPAFRAISPVLCHVKPRLARERLLAPDRRDLDPVITGLEDQVPLLI